MSYFISQLPHDLVCHIKDYVLSVDIKLELLYQKYNINEEFIKKRLKVFTSKQLEIMNSKYLYYKIYDKSFYGNEKNLVPIFKYIPNEYFTFIDDSLNINLRVTKYKLHSSYIRKYMLEYCISKSDLYSENVKTEVGRKRTQYNKITGALLYIKNARWSSKIPEFDRYMCNVEYELLKAIIILHNILFEKQKIIKKFIKKIKDRYRNRLAKEYNGDEL